MPGDMVNERKVASVDAGVLVIVKRYVRDTLPFADVTTMLIVLAPLFSNTATCCPAMSVFPIFTVAACMFLMIVKTTLPVV